jgi:hypothetical protein
VSLSPASTAGLSQDAQQVLTWMKEHYYGGRPPVWSVQEIARGVYGRTEGPAPGVSFDPSTWGRLRTAIYELQERGLMAQGRLPQGDFGYTLVV